MAELKHGVPYHGLGSDLELNKEVYYPQLADEIQAHVPEGVHFVGVRNATSDHMTLHFSELIEDLSGIQSVVDAHVPDESYGLTPEEKEYEELKTKLGNGDLPVKELNKLLKHALLQGKL